MKIVKRHWLLILLMASAMTLAAACSNRTTCPTYGHSTTDQRVEFSS